VSSKNFDISVSDECDWLELLELDSEDELDDDELELEMLDDDDDELDELDDDED